jgi:pimeloyl-ACP methyl ester carboxylesterase
VLANGLGGSLRAWGPFLRKLRSRRRIVSWDYRGLYRSGPPAEPSAVTIEDHAADLGAVLEQVVGEPAVVIGWSMGVQIAVEYALEHPTAVSGLVLVAGSPGDPYAGVLHASVSRVVIPPATFAVQAAALPFGLAMRALTVSPRRAAEALRAVGVLAPSADLDAFTDLAHEFARLDWRVYMRTIRAMGRHDAWPRMAELPVPTLVVGGTADLFLPQASVEAMARDIPGAELLVLPGGTHYLPVEFPEQLAARVDRFLAERVPS